MPQCLEGRAKEIKGKKPSGRDPGFLVKGRYRTPYPIIVGNLKSVRRPISPFACGSALGSAEKVHQSRTAFLCRAHEG